MLSSEIHTSPHLLTPKPYTKKVTSIPFGFQKSSVSWFPQTPREPYVQRFFPTPKNSWMTGLRVDSSQQVGIEYPLLLSAREEERNKNRHLSIADNEKK